MQLGSPCERNTGKHPERNTTESQSRIANGQKFDSFQHLTGNSPSELVVRERLEPKIPGLQVQVATTRRRYLAFIIKDEKAYGSCNFENFQNITRDNKSRNAPAFK